MLDFIICAITNFLRIYLVFQFAEVFLEKTEAEKSKIFLVYAIYYVINTSLFWIFHTAWINVLCNLIGISAIVRLYTKSIKINLFTTCSIYFIHMGCDIAVIVTFTNYEDGQPFSQIYEVLVIFLILIYWFLIGRIITIHKHTEEMLNFPLILVPLCSIAIILLLIYFNACEEVGLAIVCIGLLVINFFLFYLYNQLLYSFSQKYETEMLKQKVQIYSNQLDVILQSEEKVKSLKHDMKHHMNELKLLANKYAIEEMQHYIDQMEAFIHNPKEIVASGNAEIDSVLNYMLQKAKDELETVLVKVMLPEEIRHSFDINVLLGNLLENAIEAARQTDRKYLSVYLALKRGVLKVQIDNSFLAVDMLENKDGDKIFLTTKKRKEQHGVGLKNVKKIVESYNGNMKIETENDIFRVKLILYMSKIEN